MHITVSSCINVMSCPSKRTKKDLWNTKKIFWTGPNDFWLDQKLLFGTKFLFFPCPNGQSIDPVQNVAIRMYEIRNSKNLQDICKNCHNVLVVEAAAAAVSVALFLIKCTNDSRKLHSIQWVAAQ